MRISTLFEAGNPVAPSASKPLTAPDRRLETAGIGASPQGHPSLLHLKKEEVPILCSCPVSGPEIVSTANPNPGPTPTASSDWRHRQRTRYLSPGDPKSSSHHHQSNFPRRPTWRLATDRTSPTFSCRPRPPFFPPPHQSILFFAKHPPFSFPYSSLLSIPTDAPTATRRCSVAESTTTARRMPKYSHPLQLAARTLSFFLLLVIPIEYRNTPFSSSHASPPAAIEPSRVFSFLEKSISCRMPSSQHARRR